MRAVAPAEAALAFRGGALFVDVRPAVLHRRDGLTGSRNLPLEVIQAGRTPSELARDQPVYVVCERGQVSELAALYLEQDGFRQVHHVLGGLRALRPLL